MHGEVGTGDAALVFANGNAFEAMLRVSASLHDESATVELIRIYEGDGRAVRGQSIDECADAFRQTWAAALRIEIA